MRRRACFGAGRNAGFPGQTGTGGGGKPAPLGQELPGDRVVRSLVVPDRTRDPPPLAVPEELDRVDPAALHGSVRGLPCLVRREDMSDVAETPGHAVDLALVKALRDHRG